jgi:hypothetical protein
MATTVRRPAVSDRNESEDELVPARRTMSDGNDGPHEATETHFCY